MHVDHRILRQESAVQNSEYCNNKEGRAAEVAGEWATEKRSHGHENNIGNMYGVRRPVQCCRDCNAPCRNLSSCNPAIPVTGSGRSQFFPFFGKMYAYWAPMQTLQPLLERTLFVVLGPVNMTLTSVMIATDIFDRHVRVTGKNLLWLSCASEIGSFLIRSDPRMMYGVDLY